MNVMMLTAGEGTRLRPHTQFLPKPAIPFLNVPLYSYPIYFLNEIKITKLVLNTFHLPQKLKTTVSDFKYEFPVHFSDEEKLLGSGGGLENAKRFFQSEGDFILMNGDEVIIPRNAGIVDAAIRSHRSSGAIATLLVMDHPEVGTKFGGVWVDGDKNILGFGKEPHTLAVKGYHYIGVAILSDKIFDFLKAGESNILYDGVVEAIKNGHTARIERISCLWFETGNEKDFKSATQKCMTLLSQNNFESSYLDRLIRWRSPNSEYIKGANNYILADKNLNLDVGTMTGFNVLSEGVSLKKGCRLRNCILGPRVQVRNADQLENVMIINDQDVF